MKELVFHAVPDAAQIDPVHVLELCGADISHLYGRRLNAGVVECRIQATEGGYSLLDHCCYLSLISDIAADADRLVTLNPA